MLCRFATTAFPVGGFHVDPFVKQNVREISKCLMTVKRSKGLDDLVLYQEFFSLYNLIFQLAATNYNCHYRGMSFISMFIKPATLVLDQK